MEVHRKVVKEFPANAEGRSSLARSLEELDPSAARQEALEQCR